MYLELGENSIYVSKTSFGNLKIFIERFTMENRLRCVVKERGKRKQLLNFLNRYLLLKKELQTMSVT